MNGERRWRERRGGVLFGVVFFGIGALLVAYLQFFREPASPMTLEQTFSFWQLLAWPAVVGGTVMAIIGIVRLTIRRDVVVLEGDRLHFRIYGRRGQVERAEIRDVDVSTDGKSVFLHLDVDRPGTRERAGLGGGRDQISFHGPAYKDGSDLPQAVADWAAGD